MKTKIQYVFVALVGCILLLTTGCSDEPEIRTKYEFEIETMPIPKRLKRGETVEIRCKLIREGYYEDTRYFIRYFQTDGKGELRLENGPAFIPNDYYLLDQDIFRLYYTSLCDEQQQFDVYFEDSFNQRRQLSFSFSHDGSSE